MAIRAADNPIGPRPGHRHGATISDTVTLLTYADRLAGDLPGLDRVLREELPEFNGVHILPFYDPYDGVDAGFDPIDHTAVDPRLGTWEDLRSIGDRLAVTADVIVNHVSVRSQPVQSFLADDGNPRWDGVVLTFDSVFNNKADEDSINRFYRPRPGLPFTPVIGADGTRRLVWTTFSPEQVDIDVGSLRTREYLHKILRSLADAGVRTVRLDAIGYAVKTAGTSSFMTAETYAFLDDLLAECHSLDLEVLVEVHSDYHTQLTVSGHADRIYDFALPPLLLHAVYQGELAPLEDWLAVRPTSAIAVLDTHDGIGVVDAVAEAGPGSGFLTPLQADALFEEAARRTRGRSRITSVTPQFAPRPHQINAAFLSVLGNDTDALVGLRAIQLFLPGPSHVYYGGMLGLTDDFARFEATGVGREINRSVLDDGSRQRALSSLVSRAQRALVSLRTTHPAFSGAAEITVDSGSSVLEILWRAPGGDQLKLVCQFTAGTVRTELTATSASKTRDIQTRSLAQLAALLPC